MNEQQQITISPQQVAAWTLEFLDGADIKGRDAERFGMVRAFQMALARGSLQVMTPPQQPAAPDQAAAVPAPPAETKTNGATPPES